MGEKLKSKKYFPTIVGEVHLPKNKSKLLSKIEEESYIFSELDEQGRRWSQKNYAGGYTSYSSALVLEEQSPYFAALKKWIDVQVKQFANTLQFDFSQGSLKQNSYWINIMGPYCQHSYHLHPYSAISGTFFVKTPKGSGKFKFEDPRVQCFMSTAPRKQPCSSDQKRYIEITPKAGTLLLFESWMKHEVLPHNSMEEERISLSFNYHWEWK